MSNDTKI